jgi:DNA-binding MarR family transcriptional regulator
VAALEDNLTDLVRALAPLGTGHGGRGGGVSVSEAHALLELQRVGSLTATELSRSLRLEKSTVSRLVRLLDDRGWLVRRVDTRDGRVLHLRLSAAGRRVAKRLAEARRRQLRALLDRVPPADRAGVARTLEILGGAARAHAVEPPSL